MVRWMLGAGIMARVLGPTSSFMASAFREHGLRESSGQVPVERDRTNAAFNQLPLDRLWTPCFTAFRPYTGKSRLLRRLESSKFPRDASSWAQRAQLEISVQASRTSAYFGRADFKEKGLFVYSGFAVALAVSHCLPCTTWTPLRMPTRTDS